MWAAIFVFVLWPCTVRHKFRDGAIIQGGRPVWPPLRNRIQVMEGSKRQQSAAKSSDGQQKIGSVSLTACRGRHNRRPAANPVHSQILWSMVHGRNIIQDFRLHRDSIANNVNVKNRKETCGKRYGNGSYGSWPCIVSICNAVFFMQRRSKIWRILASLSKMYRKVIFRRYYDDYSCRRSVEAYRLIKWKRKIPIRVLLEMVLYRYFLLYQIQLCNKNKWQLIMC